jgi:RHS repeat-associated protein
VTTQFLYEGSRLVAEYDGSGNLLRRYVWGPGTDEPLVWYEGGVGSTDRRWLHTDERGSVIGQSNNAGVMTQTYAYGAYGEPQDNWGAGSRFRYTGQIALPEVQVYHYKARVYDPMTGRFLQTDPIGYSADLNDYAYVEEDPTGLCTGSRITNDDGTCASTGGNTTDSSGVVEGAMRGQANGQSQNGSQAGATPGSGHSDQTPTDDVNEGRRRMQQEDAATDKAMLPVKVMMGVSILGPDVVLAGAEVVEAGAAKMVVSACKCFVAGTLVATQDGERAIETIKVGDLVLSRDEVTGQTALKPVVAIIPVQEDKIWNVVVRVSGAEGPAHTETIHTTGEHPFRTEDGRWTLTDALQIGTGIVTVNGAPAVVVSVANTNKMAKTYNLEVADFHTYFVGNDKLWVHNACPLKELLGPRGPIFGRKYLGGRAIISGDNARLGWGWKGTQAAGKRVFRFSGRLLDKITGKKGSHIDFWTEK